jgi:hypothetical protein
MNSERERRVVVPVLSKGDDQQSKTVGRKITQIDTIQNLKIRESSDRPRGEVYYDETDVGNRFDKGRNQKGFEKQGIPRLSDNFINLKIRVQMRCESKFLKMTK